MDERIQKLLFDPGGPLGLTDGFYQNVVAEFGGFILAAVVFSIVIPIVIDGRQARKWQPARVNFGQELLHLHVAFGEALLRFVRTPAGAARLRAADVVDNAYRAFPTLTGLYGYALTADISREANDYMRLLRALRDWAYEAAHPEDVGFAAVERRVPQTREMFAQANKEFKDVLDVLRVSGFDDVHWHKDMIAEFSAAFDASHAAAKHHNKH
ncbi:MAG: hypothetical protein K8S25_13600 [Alphaproteobacteria bacterium]|nr:hypothetical protein [Alphaproteobacteria bacterium]